MAPLTWRNVDAPNFSGVTDALRLVGTSINNAGDGFIKAIDSYQEGKTQGTSSQLMLDVARAKDAAGVEAALNSTALNPRYLDPAALNFATKYQAQLQAQGLAEQRLALAASKAGGKGGSGGGRGTSAEGISQGKNVIGNIGEDGKVIMAPTTSGPLTALPTDIPDYAAAEPETNDEQAQLVTPAPAVSAPIVLGSSDGTGDVRPLAQTESAFGAPNGMMSQLSNASSGDPAQQLINDIRRTPVPGPIAVPRKVGKDGDASKMIDAFVAQDIGNAAMLSTQPGQDNLDDANRLVANNPRILRNLNATNVAVTIDKNQDRSIKATNLAGDNIKLAVAQDAETERLTNKDIKEQAKEYVADHQFDWGKDGAAFKAAIPTDTPLELYKAITDRFNDVSGSGMLDAAPDEGGLDANGNYRPPAKYNKGVGGGSLPSTPPTADKSPISPTGVGSVAGDAVVADASAKSPEAAAKVETALATVTAATPYAGRDLDTQRKQFQEINNQVKLDTIGNTVRPLLADFDKTVASVESDTDVANNLIAKGRFKGANVDDVANAVRTIRTKGKINAALAGRIMENAPRTPYSIEAPFRSIADRFTDQGEVDKLLNYFVDENGKPKPDILSEATKIQGVDEYQKNLNQAWENLQTSQQDLDTKIQYGATGKAKNVNTTLAAKAVEFNQKEFDRLRGESSKYGFQNRGDYPREIAAPVVRPQQGPNIPANVQQFRVQDQLRNAVANSAVSAAGGQTVVPVQRIFDNLLSKLDHTPTNQEKRDLLKQARSIANSAQ